MKRSAPGTRAILPRVRHARAIISFLAACVFAAVAAWSFAPRARACLCGPPKDCSRSTSVIKAWPAAIVLAPAGGVLPLPVWVFNSLLSSPGAGMCPTVTGGTVALTITCTGAAAQPTVGAPIPPPGGMMLGNNVFTVPITFPPSGPRVCTVRATAMVTWSDGAVTNGVGDVEICIVEPAPGSTSVPRLDMKLLTPPIQATHPGNQVAHVVRLTNNDPSATVTGTITTTAHQNAHLSTVSPTPPPGSGSGVSSIASPVTGDAFTIQDHDAAVPAPPAGNNYVDDDGSLETGIGVSPAGSLIWLNDFVVAPGATVIDKVSVAFGAGVNGRPVSILVYSDPNNDGNPSDAVLLTQFDTAAADAGTALYHEYAIPATTPGPAGSHFFAGVLMQNTAPPELPASIDTTASAHRSWVAADASCRADARVLAANDLPPALIDSFGFPGNFGVRVHGSAAPVLRPCVETGDPAASNVLTLSRTITLCPGETKFVRIDQMPYRMCTSGSCNEVAMKFIGTFSDSTPALACVAPAVMVKSDVPPAYRCPKASLMTTATPADAGTSIAFTGTTPSHPINERFRVTGVQIVPLEGPPLLPQPPVSGILDQFPAGNAKGRIATRSLPSGPLLTINTPFQATINLQLLAQTPGEVGALQTPDVHPGDHTQGDTYFSVNLSSALSGPAIPPTSNSFFDVFAWVSLDGVTSGLHHAAQINMTSISAITTSATTATISFQASFPNDPQLPPTIGEVRTYIDGVGSAYGEPAVPVCPLILGAPENTTAMGGGRATLYTVADGSDPLSFRWRRNGVNLSDGPSPFGTISGAGSSALVIRSLTLMAAGNYDCVVTNACGTATSTPAALTIMCPADVDDGSGTGHPDGGVTIDDLLYYLSLFGAGDIRADLDDGSGTGTRDGGVTIDDLLYYLTRFAAGC